MLKNIIKILLFMFIFPCYAMKRSPEWTQKEFKKAWLIENIVKKSEQERKEDLIKALRAYVEKLDLKDKIIALKIKILEFKI